LPKRCIVTPRQCVVGCIVSMKRASMDWVIGPKQADHAA
jgi:hypothetical protein